MTWEPCVVLKDKETVMFFQSHCFSLPKSQSPNLIHTKYNLLPNINTTVKVTRVSAKMPSSRSSRSSSSSSSSSSSESGHSHSTQLPTEAAHQRGHDYSISGLLSQLRTPSRRASTEDSPRPDPETDEGNGEVEAEGGNNHPASQHSSDHQPSPRSSRKTSPTRPPSTEPLLGQDEDDSEVQASYSTFPTLADTENLHKTCKDRLRGCWGIVLAWFGYGEKK
ncbi:hypothetical protein M426DRAFT_20705 [Hypoxylon sp. CI-4A]|nr:hypothetical protein M426DRAFT_20705 [Hypoxylon sp. CI-4A]